MAKDIDKKEERTDAERLSQMKEFYDLGKTNYAAAFKKMRMLDLTDKGRFWEAIGAKFPAYQLLPDMTFITYLKTNLLAALYTVTKSAEVVPTAETDRDLCMNLNIALEHFWDTNDVGYIEFLAGERAALTNLGITQVGWDESITGGFGETFQKGDVTLKNILPNKFMRDPFSENIEEAAWCCTYDSFPKAFFTSNPLYKKAFAKFLESHKEGTPDPLPSDNKLYSTKKNYYNLIKFWVREDDNTITEYHTVDLKAILYRKDDIQPSTMPFAELYYNIPNDDPIGVSAPAKQFANQVTYNILDSIAYTAIYKNQFPPKFVSSSAQLNIAAFSKHGAEAERTFVVAGDPDKVIKYHQFPDISAVLPAKQQALYYGIQEMSGVDGHYTGRDTGSIITTGGTEKMLNRVTLSDAPAVMNYEHYTKRLSKLILTNLLNFAPKRKYLVKDKEGVNEYKTVEVDFPNVNSNTLLTYAVQISSDLPKNKQSIAAFANTMMEKQMQYQEMGQQVDLITNEEWLEMQDIPYKERMLKRMGIQRTTSALDEAAQVIDEYSQMLNQGIPPKMALDNAALGLQNKRAGQPSPFQEGALIEGMPE